MNIDRFYYFLEVVKTQNISLAAKNCYISQTAMTQQIHALEQELGVTLFVRKKQGTFLTQQGELLVDKVKVLINNYEDILSSFKSEAKQVLTIAYTGPLEQQYLIPAIKKFSNYYPNISVELKQYSMADIGNALKNKECDIALALPNEINDSNLIHTTILKKKIYVAVNNDSPLANKKRLSFKELKGYPIILLEKDSCLNASKDIEIWLTSMGFSDSNIIYADTIENQLMKVNLKQGITFVPKAKYLFDIKLIPLEKTMYHYTDAFVRDMNEVNSKMIDCLKQACG